MPRSRFYYKTESLSSYTARVARDLPRVSHLITHHIGEKLEMWIKRFTPRDTDTLYDSIEAGPIISEASVKPSFYDHYINNNYVGAARWRRMYTVEVSTDVDYAPYVEYDTGKHGPNGPYLITPQKGKYLSWIGRDGKRVYVTKVMHPGSRGRHMFARGSARVTPVYIRNQSRPILAAWKARHATARPR